MVLTRNYPVVLGAGVAILLFSLVGGAAITGVLPQDIGRSNPHATPLIDTTALAAAARKGHCRSCGIVSAIRPMRVESAAGNFAAYSVTVRMDDGSERNLSQQKAPAFAVGARVRLNGDAIERS